MHTKHIRPFLCVAREGSIARAAQALHRAPSAVSRSVQELEAALGAPLFERHPGRWLPTPAGRLLLHHAEAAFAQLEAACEALCRRHPGLAGRIRHAPFFSLGVHERRLALLFAFTARRPIASAAALVGVTQPAASMALHEMEAAAGVPLFDRTHAGVALTESGELLVVHLKRALAQLRLAADEISALRGVVEGQVVIGALPFSRPYVLPAAIGRVLARHPRLHVRTVEGPLDGLVSALALGDVDFLVGALPAEPPGHGLMLEQLAELAMEPLARSDHPLAGRDALTLADLLAVPWVLPPSGTPSRTALDACFADAGLGSPRVAVESSDISVIRGLLLETDMLTAASRQLFLHELQAGALVTLPVALPGTERPIGVLRRAPEHASPGARELLEEIRRVASGG
ncbi:LysR substrate-binding domain-containing protein [Ramlibacter rhizophilus]|uniref:LysR family transcriptional regulator n=1 Tax=Ramlibacter rhizophilus TaxID=1781167 RepID=A0A4Z0BH37_9BURK|nr:LysR substrate-binding domain-containing protein [Ramlibacter rhizophilus]TFY97444.1 LysR family transcriptional regulator [Ramlibacter rhizophilus]